MLISEGGNAAQILIDKKLSKHSKEKLEQSGISTNELDKFFPASFEEFPKDDGSIISKILVTLASKNLIDPAYLPTYRYGSTRLAAAKVYGPEKFVEPEEQPAYEKALVTKNSFGDLDLDLKFTGSKQEIADAVESIDPKTFATMVTSEVHVAVRFSGNRVAQIDLVNAEELGARGQVWQRSSILDMAEGYKGVLLVSLLRAVTSTMKVSKADLSWAFTRKGMTDPGSKKGQTLKKLSASGWKATAAVFSLKDRGPTLVMQYSKNGKTQNVDVGLSAVTDYSDLSALAQTVLQDKSAKPEDIMHFVNLAKTVSVWPKVRKLKTIKQFKAILEKQNIPEEIKQKGLSALLPKQSITENLLLEGGAYGHMMSPWEDLELSFYKLKRILHDAADGKLQGTEKTDGWNVYLSYRDGVAVAARNKNDIQTGGKDAKALAAREFAGGDQVKKVFIQALRAFEKGVRALPDKWQEKMFEGGTIFYNAELMGPSATNTVNYDKDVITIHRLGHYKLNPSTKEITPFAYDEQAAWLDKMINKMEQASAGEAFAIQKFAFIKLQSISAGTDFKIAKTKLDKVMQAEGMSDSNTLEDYATKRLLSIVREKLPETSEQIQINIAKNLLGAEKLALPQGTPKDFRGRVSAIKASQKDLVKSALWPVEEIITDFSIEMLKGVESVYILDNQKEVQRLRKEVKKTIDIIQSSNNREAIDFLVAQLQKLKNIESITTPIEGFVFTMNGKTYKLTGNFAPVNQLLGLFKYGRKGINITEVDKLEEKYQPKAIAILPGGFKPPHVGHYTTAKQVADMPDVDEVLVFISPKERAGHSSDSRVVITAEMALQIWKIYVKDETKIKVAIADTTSPVKLAYSFMGKMHPGDTLLFVQGDKEGDGRFKDAQKYSDKYNLGITVRTISVPVITSGTYARELLASGKQKDFYKILPKHLSPEEKLQVWNIVNQEMLQETNELRNTQLSETVLKEIIKWNRTKTK